MAILNNFEENKRFYPLVEKKRLFVECKFLQVYLFLLWI